jgi:EAL domain-containing protein (putative c-di-GMP-specific phosphodiesterase class I)
VVDERREAEQTLPKSTSVRLPELRTAITTGALVLYYQPYRERGCEQFSQVEALVRWPHPVEGLLVPGAFLPLAEVSGLMGELDRWVLSEACRQARAWRDTGRPTRIAVNASAASIHDPEYSAVVMRTLARHGLPGSAIEIEITEESAFEGSDERLLILASELQALGVRLAIDDFGTGASSLSRLRDMPVETLKIDRSFVTTALTNPRDAAITESIVGLAKRLGLKTVAEGVEDAATLAYLDGLGVDYIQGYFVCRPVPPAELFARLWAAGDE